LLVLKNRLILDCSSAESKTSEENSNKNSMCLSCRVFHAPKDHTIMCAILSNIKAKTSLSLIGKDKLSGMSSEPLTLLLSFLSSILVSKDLLGQKFLKNI